MPRWVGGQRGVAVRAGEQQTTTVTSTQPAAIAVGVLAVGLGALTQQGAGAPEAAEQLKSLSDYASAFAAEL
eukprot:gene11595-11739_t